MRQAKEAELRWPQWPPSPADIKVAWGSGGAHVQSGRHASTEAAGCWGPWRSALALWLRLETKFKRALGPGATVGVLDMGVSRLACLRPMVRLHQQPGTAQ